MKVIPYTITLLEPSLITGLEGDPNSAVSYDFLPGGVLKGALIGRYIEAYGAIDAADDDVRRLFFDPEKTRFLNGYPLVRDARWQTPRRSLPTPLSWQQPKAEKASPGTVHRQPTETFDFYDNAYHEVDQPVSVGGSFWVPSQGGAHFVTPHRRIAIHTTRDRQFGRARAGSGAVFSYESLIRDQTFQAIVLCQDSDVTTFKNLIGGMVQLGGARSAGYGQAKLELGQATSANANEEVQFEDANDWNEAPSGSGMTDGRVVITLLSDVLLRDDNGQWTVDPALLADELELELAPGTSVFAAARPIGGFNNKWGLPIPQAQAFQMGSVLLCKSADDARLERLKARTLTGIGARREDGFGRFALNWHTEGTWRAIPELDEPSLQDVRLSGEDETTQKMVLDVAKRVWQNRLDRQLTARSGRLAESARYKSLSKSQIYRLRLAVQESLRHIAVRIDESSSDLDGEREILKRYLQSLRDRATPRKQFDRARVDNVPMLAWLEKVIDSAEMTDNSVMTPGIGGISPDPSHARSVLEYNLRLIDAVLARMAKQKREAS